MKSKKTASFPTSTLAAALVGAAGGALAIYLFDPQAGHARRQRVAGAAQDAIGRARQDLESLAGKAREHARHAQDVAASAVNGVVQSAQDAGHAQLGAASEALAAHAQRLSDRLSHNVHRATDRWLHRGGRAVAALRGEDESNRVIPLALAAAGFCAAGVGLMWLLDPDRGRSRRARIAGQATHVLNKTSRTFNSTGHHLRNMLAGYAARAQQAVDAVDPKHVDSTAAE